MASPYNDRNIYVVQDRDAQVKSIKQIPDTSTAISGAVTLTAADGGNYTVAKTAGYAITLPPPQQGLNFKFVALDTGANAVTISDGSAHLFGTVVDGPAAMLQIGNNAGNVGLSEITLASANDVGDHVIFEGVDSTHYIVYGASLQASKITVS